MKKLVFIFAALFALGFTSCDTKPVNQGDGQDTTAQVEVITADSNQVDTPEVAPETTKDAQDAAGDTTAKAPQE